LGAQAIDPLTLRLTLEHPAPYLPQIAKHTSMYPVPKHMVERWGDGWSQPGRYVSNGPFRPISWTIGDHIRTVKNPRFFDAAHVCVGRIDYYPTNDQVSAERRVRRGELDVNTLIQSSRVAWLRRPDQAPRYVHIHPYLGLAYVVFNTRDVPALKDVRVRQALSMAIDREFITGKLLRAGQQPAYAFVPPGVAGYPAGPRVRWAGWTLGRRQAEARRLLAQAGYGPSRPLTLEFKLPNTTDGMTFAPAIQADWKAVGVRTSLIQNESQIAFEAFRIRDFQTGLASWIADYNDPMTFLYLLQSGTGQQNYGDYSNPAYDALLAQADQEPDPGRRAEELSRAEQIMLDDAANAPLYFLVSRNLVSPAITGWRDNISDIHRARYLCVTGR
ncbi:MAG: peptide ABC transporter substrate-binding protein, partial [Phenylobacterium sp.]